MLFFIILPAYPSILINELQPSNSATDLPGTSSNPDWVELFNSGSDKVSLNGWSITDNINDPLKYEFVDTEIEAGSFLILLCNDKSEPVDGYISLPFKLSSGGETVYIYENSILRDSLQFPEMEKDWAWGRFPDGEDLMRMPKPSPGRSNIFSDRVGFSHDPGFYSTDLLLKVSSELNMELRYTTDGSEPTFNSKVLEDDGLLLGNASLNPNIFSMIKTTRDEETSPTFIWKEPDYLLEKSNIIRVGSFSPEGVLLEVVSGTFFIDEDIFQRFSLPVVSLYGDPEDLFSDSSGIYVPGYEYENNKENGNFFMSGREWEREVIMEYFLPDGTKTLSQKVGVRTKGNSTRAAIQKSLKLYARNEYGDDDIDYRFFDDKQTDRFERLELMSSVSEWGQQSLIRNSLFYRLAEGLNMEYPSGRPVVVFLNGEYWGIHALRERVDEDFIDTYFDLDKDSINIMATVRGAIKHGTNSHFLDLVEFLKVSDMSLEENYKYVADRLDIANFIDHNILYIFAANVDWPANNCEHWNALGEGYKIRYFPLDADAAFYLIEDDMMRHATQDTVEGWPNGATYTMMFRKMLKNTDFRKAFIERYVLLLNTVFLEENVVAEVSKIAAAYSLEIPYHQMRFPLPDPISDWQIALGTIYEFAEKRPCAALTEIKDYFSEEAIDYECETISVPEPDPVFRVYPQPCGDALFYRYESIKGNSVYRVFDIMGKEVLSGVDTGAINTVGLGPGVYLLELAEQEGVLVYKFFVKK